MGQRTRLVLSSQILSNRLYLAKFHQYPKQALRSQLATTATIGAVVFLTILLLLYLGFAVFTYNSCAVRKRKFKTRKLGEKVLGWTLSLAIFFALLAVLLAYLGRAAGGNSAADLDGLTGALSAAFGVVGAVVARFVSLGKNDLVKGRRQKFLVWSSGIVLLAGLALTSFALAAWHDPMAAWSWRNVIYFVVFVIVLHFSNVNHYGLHGLYANRLMETFLPGARTALALANLEIDPGQKRTALQDPRAAEELVHDFRITGATDQKQKHPGRLFQIINTNVVLANSKNRKFLGRGGDSFMVTPLYSGSACDALSAASTSSFNFFFSKRPSIALSRRCCTDQLQLRTRPTGDGIQAVRSNLGQPSPDIRLRTRTPILASVL